MRRAHNPSGKYITGDIHAWLVGISKNNSRADSIFFLNVIDRIGFDDNKGEGCYKVLCLGVCRGNERYKCDKATKSQENGVPKTKSQKVWFCSERFYIKWFDFRVQHE